MEVARGWKWNKIEWKGMKGGGPTGDTKIRFDKKSTFFLYYYNDFWIIFNKDINI